MGDKRIVSERKLYGYVICAEVTFLKEDIHVLLTGGSLPHTGAVSMYCNGRKDGVIQPEGHKDETLSDRWSRRLSEEFHCRTTVVCGIHYENLTKGEIVGIISVTEDMLEEVIRKRKEKQHGEKESQ